LVRKGANTPVEAFKMRRVAGSVTSLIEELDAIAGRMVNRRGSSVSEIKQKLKTESEKRRSGQMATAAPCDPIEKADGPNLKGCMIAIYPDAEIAKRIAVPNGEHPNRIHMTVVYFEDASSDRTDWEKAGAILTELARHLPVPKGILTGTGRFVQPDGEVAYATIDLPHMEMWRDVLVEQLERAGFRVSKKYTFKPHLTLAYTEKDAPFPDTALRIESLGVTFPEIHMVQGDKRVVTAPFKEQAPSK